MLLNPSRSPKSALRDRVEAHVAHRYAGKFVVPGRVTNFPSMWKSVRALLVASVVTCFATALLGAPVDVKDDPADALQVGRELGDGNPAVRHAQVREQRATNVSQISYNIITDGGATCNGDMVTLTRPTTIARGTRVLTISTDTFTSGDVGKAIVIPGAGPSGGRLQAYIRSFTDAQHVVLNRHAETTLFSASAAITYGTDDAPAFMKFNTWARANQGSGRVVLTVPNGASCWFGSPVASIISVANAWAAGINNLIVEGTGATISAVGGAAFWLGGRGVCQAGIASAGGCSARIETASAGATRVTLTASSLAAGYISRFPVGKWLMLGGLDTQGLWKAPYGYPPNQTFFEWRRVAAVDALTGVITLDRPLGNTYLSTWPNYNQGNNFEADNGGPATIWAVHDTWSASVEYRGLTINQDGQTYSPARHVTYRGVRFGGGHGGIPTQNETWSAINTSFANVNMEVDKLIGTMTMDGVTISQIVFQSSSTDRFIMKNSTVTKRLDGGGKRTEITDSKLNNFGPGIWAYGGTNGATICTRCAIGTLNFDFGIFQNHNPSPYSMSGGVISFPNIAASGGGPAQRWVVPGTKIYWSAPGYLTIGLFQIQAVTQDATNTYIQTNEAGGFPALASPIFYRTHPSSHFTCDACTGDPAAVATNIQSGATPLAPLATYSRRSYAPTGPSKNLGSLFVKGKLVSLTINVTQAYTGTGPAILNPTGESHNFAIKQSDWTVYDWWPTINLKVAGERVITPSGVTCNGAPGACSGDLNMTVPEAIWIQSGMGPSLPSKLSGGVAPTFTITVRTDQSVVP